MVLFQKKYLLYCLLLLLAFSCNNSQLKSITIYKTSFDINHPFRYSKSKVKSVKPYHIKGSMELKNIESLINELMEKVVKEDFINDVYMVVVFNYRDGRKVEMLYNKMQIKFRENVYKDFPELIDYLLIHQLPEELPVPSLD